MPKPKGRSRYIRRVHRREERARIASERELRELQEELRGQRGEARLTLPVVAPTNEVPCMERGA